jgi:cob(I)alamin adenosyltransferase
MAARIYTKTGDLGSTVLIGGTKVPKSHIRIESYGTVDELNSYIGLIADLIVHDKSANMLREIQDRLFTIGSSLACDPDKEPLMKIPDLEEGDVKLLETEIDGMTALLPEMRSFVLPGGHPTVSHIHIARCICRRAERICVHMQEMEMFIDPLVIKYINRLSDYLFVLSRFIAQELKVQEVPWKPRISKS